MLSDKIKINNKLYNSYSYHGSYRQHKNTEYCHIILIIMQDGGHFSKGARYGTNEIVAFSAEYSKHGAIGEAFFDSSITHSLKKMVPGKRVLDIGCGVGDWSCLIAHCGAKTVHGFDIQKEMVELATQATSHLDNVHIQVGDAADMLCDDASFDVAISFFVTCNLSPETIEKHFQELYRVLSPGGKAILLIPSDWYHSGLYTTFEADSDIVEKEIAQILKMVPRHPTTAQVSEAFKKINDILVACFAVDVRGNLFHVKNISQLKHGQPIWAKTEMMTFPNFFYSDRTNVTNIIAAGFHIDSIENNFTEERRVAYNSKKPNFPLKKEFVENPLVLIYHISKPL